MAKDFTPTALASAKIAAVTWLNDHETDLSVNSVALGSGTYTITFGQAGLSALKTSISAIAGAADDFTLQIHGHFKGNATKIELAFIHIKCLTGGNPPEIYLASTEGTPTLTQRYMKRIHDVAVTSPGCGDASQWPLSDAYKRLVAERERQRLLLEAQRKATRDRDAALERERQRRLEEELRLREDKRKADDEKKKKGTSGKTDEELRYQAQRRASALAKKK